MENTDTEWKETWAPKNLKTIAAFYNTEGGRMIIGRRDDGSYIGVDDVKGTLKEISDTIHNKLHIACRIRAELEGELCCIAVDVPVGNSMVALDGRFYIRSGNTTQEIEGNDLKRAILSEQGLQWLDQTTDVPVSDLSESAIGYFIKTGKKAGRIPESIDESDVPAIMSKYHILKEQRPTLAAVLLFHEDPYSFNYGAMVKIGRFDEERTLLRDDMIGGPMIEVPEKAMHLLYNKYIPPTYGYGGLTVSGHMDYDYPQKAVRELIVNAVVHMDYSLQQPIEISVFDDRLELFSAGGLPEGQALSDLMRRHRSIRRNETLASVFYSAGYVENWAQGIAKVMKECAENGNPEPEFSLELGGLLVTMYKRSPGPEGMIVKPDKDKDPESALDQRILKAISESSTLSTKNLSEKLGVPTRTVRRHLARLVDTGQIVRVGNNSSTEYAMKNRRVD